MKLKELLSEKFSPSTYAYHATNGKYLRSILKHGLVPNKSKGGYGSNEVSKNFGYSLEALPGVYFTDDMNHAMHVARHVDGTGLIIIAKVQKKDATMDEDFLVNLLGEQNILRSIRHNEQAIKRNIDQFVDDLTTDVINKFPSSINQHIINNIKPDVRAYIELLVKLQGTDDLEDWSSQQRNEAIKKLQITLTNKLRRLVQKDNSTHNTFKINGTVGFSGANRIVGIYNIITGEGWGDLGQFERDAYYKVKNPMELVKNREDVMNLVDKRMAETD